MEALPCRAMNTRAAWALGLGTAVIFFIGAALDVPTLRLAAKPWPVVLLAVFCLRERRDVYAYLIAAGLFASAAGDVLLEIAPGLFLAGLASFLVAHLCYVAAFLLPPRALQPLRA